MKNYNRDLLLLYKEEVYNDELIQYEVECLHRILMTVERSDVFCRSHELATRTKITGKAKAILKATEWPELKPFTFLINKN
jgi:hypothetical protein